MYTSTYFSVPHKLPNWKELARTERNAQSAVQCTTCELHVLPTQTADKETPLNSNDTKSYPHQWLLCRSGLNRGALTKVSVDGFNVQDGTLVEFWCYREEPGSVNFVEHAWNLFSFLSADSEPWGNANTSLWLLLEITSPALLLCLAQCYVLLPVQILSSTCRDLLWWHTGRYQVFLISEKIQDVSFLFTCVGWQGARYQARREIQWQITKERRIQPVLGPLGCLII